MTDSPQDETTLPQSDSRSLNMSLRINTNISSLTAQRNLNHVSSRLHNGYARLSSGLRIATAADDAAGLAISERIRAQTRSLAVAERNIQDGISFVRTAEGALNELSSLMVRARELTIGAMNGTNSASDIALFNEEFSAIAQEVERIIQTAEFNGHTFFNQPFGTTVDIQVGADQNDTISIGDSINMNNFGVIMDIIDLDGPFTIGFSLQITDIISDIVTNNRGKLGASENVLQSALASVQQSRQDLTASESRIRDVDVASETANLTRDRILQRAGVAVLAQANVQPELALVLLN